MSRLSYRHRKDHQSLWNTRYGESCAGFLCGAPGEASATGLQDKTSTK